MSTNPRPDERDQRPPDIHGPATKDPGRNVGPSGQEEPTARLLRLAATWNVTRPDVAERLAEREASAHRTRVETLRARWNAPRRHSEANPTREGPWGERLRQLEARLGRGVILGLIGPRRVGKTQMAVELMKAVTDRGKSALYRTATELMMLFKACYRPEATEGELDVIRAHRKPALLIIDEFARRAESEWENNLLFELLNHRYGDMTDTILACNLSQADLEACLGASLTSRLSEGGGVVQCGWGHFR